MVATRDSKEQIFNAFQQILTDRKKIDSRIATKEEEVEKEKNKQVLKLASTYTIDSIVKGLADLQLEFGTIVNSLSEKLATEASKLDELKRAINVENQHLYELQQIRVVADAVYILTQERQEADYQYELERDRKIETDEYEELKRSQERELQEENQEKEKHWAEREKIIAERQPRLREYQQKVEVFPTELDEAVKKAREEAIKEVHQDAKIKAELLEKEWESTKQGNDFKIQSLEVTIQRQTEQIESLTTQLREALKQSQTLAMKAFDTSTTSSEKIKS